MSILAEIVEASRSTLAESKRRLPLRDLEQLALEAPARPHFAEAFRAPGVHIIAELKKASPSKGVIRAEFPYLDLAMELAQNGATALSVLTEPHFFLGSLEYLRRTAEVVSIPLLRKDFLYDTYQIWEAKAFGASAALLIAAMLEPAQIRDLTQLAHEIGLSILGEAHDESEIDILLDTPVDLIGVNARNLRTFETSLDRVAGLIGRISSDRLPVAESAISTPEDVRRLQESGAAGFLIGEGIMRAEKPGEKLRELLGTA
ncbi:MAG: indole-3-glycerol phosphate synthase TrpC [Planctomycetia bacterium]|nr:indole-3-glycerol phosphate synthase TrpC [Planctomycetia bacterium]